MMKKEIHLLSRATFGPTEKELARVQAAGIENWLNSQLDPSSINNSYVEQRLEAYPTLEMTATELMNKYPRPDCTDIDSVFPGYNYAGDPPVHLIT
jgi:hypothetical protein